MIDSTASPYKFSKSVLGALGRSAQSDEFLAVNELSAITNTPVPEPIAALSDAKVRFGQVYGKDDLYAAVKSALGI